ncbi:MAG: PKD domain-containing protein [Chitinophagales bacterium]
MKNLMILMLCFISIFNLEKLQAQPYCEANFDYVIDSMSNELMFQFFDESVIWNNVIDSNLIDNIVGWEWTFMAEGFDDIQVSNEQNPNFTTNNFADNYIACLTINSLLDCMMTTCDTISLWNNNSCASFNASFWTTLSGNMASFTNFTSNSDPSISYFWDFDDGTTSTEASPVHEYDMGFYTPCLTATNSLGCVSTYCDSLVIGDVIDECSADFWSFPSDSLGPIGGNTLSWDFMDNSNADVIEWYWTFGTPNYFSYEQNPSFTFWETGYFEVCLTITTSNLCMATTCEMIFIEDGNGDPCWGNVPEAYFEASVSGTEVNFNTFGINDSINMPVMYLWDFGNGSVSTEASPTYTYDGIGNYNVCLTVTNEIGCAATYCSNVNITNDTPTFSLCGNVFIDTDIESEFDVTVYLIAYDATTNVYETVAETVAYGTTFAADSSFAWFCFDDLSEGSQYVVKSVVNPTNLLFDGFVPTYYGDVIFWNDATLVTITENEYIDINMVSLLDDGEGLATNDDIGNLGMAASNEGLISGYVMNGATEAMSNIQVMLLTLDNEPLAYTYTNEDGYYEFNTINNGEYLVYVEMIGVFCIPSDVSVTAEDNELQVNFELEGNQVSTNSVGIFANNLTLSLALDIYPNPVQNQAVIALEVKKNSNAKMSIINMLGQTILEENINLQQGKNTLNLNVSNLKNAAYFLQIQDSEGQIYMTKFVK